MSEPYIMSKNPPTETPLEFLEQFGWDNLNRVVSAWDKRHDAMWQDCLQANGITYAYDYLFMQRTNMIVDFLNTYERFIQYVRNYNKED